METETLTSWQLPIWHSTPLADLDEVLGRAESTKHYQNQRVAAIDMNGNRFLR